MAQQAMRSRKVAEKPEETAQTLARQLLLTPETMEGDNEFNRSSRQIEALISLNPNRDIRSAVLGILIEGLSNADENQRLRAVEALGGLGDGRAVQPLLEKLSDERLVRSVIISLGYIQDPMAIEPLIRFLGSEGRSIGERALGAGNGGILVETAIDALRNIAYFNENAVDLLIRHLSESDPSLRKNIVYILGRSGDTRALQPLIGMLSDDEPGVRAAACAAVGEQIGYARTPEETFQQAVSLLIEKFSDESAIVRAAAVLSVSSYSDPVIVQNVSGKLNDADRLVRTNAAHALGMIGGPNEAQSLIERLSDVNEVPSVRLEALEAIMWIAGRNDDSASQIISSAIPALVSILGAPLYPSEGYVSDDLRVRAAEALGRAPARNGEAISGLLDLFRSYEKLGHGYSRDVYLAASSSLGNLGTLGTMRELRAILDMWSENPPVRSAIEQAIAVIEGRTYIPDRRMQ